MTKMKILICRDETKMPFDINGVADEVTFSDVQLFPVEDLPDDIANDVLIGPRSVSIELGTLFDKERSE